MWCCEYGSCRKKEHAEGFREGAGRLVEEIGHIEDKGLLIEHRRGALLRKRDV